MQDTIKPKSHKFTRKEFKECQTELDKTRLKNGCIQFFESPKSCEESVFHGPFSYFQPQRWDELIYIDLQFYIDDFLLKDEFLWHKRNVDYDQIKQFAYDYLFDVLPTQLNRFSLEFMECKFFINQVCAEHIVTVIYKEIDFYKKFDVYKFFDSGLLGSGSGLLNEHTVPINLDLKFNEIMLKDSFDFDIVNPSNNPEHIAHSMVYDLKLPKEFLNLISMSIRRQIREYVFSTLNHFSNLYLLFKENTPTHIKSPEKSQKKFILKLKTSEKNGYDHSHSSTDKNETKENSESPTEKVGFFFENKLENELGPLHRFRHTTRETKFHKPLFLKNRMQNKKRTGGKNYRNKLVLYTDMNRIVLSKAVLRNETDIDRIVIEKSRLKGMYSNSTI